MAIKRYGKFSLELEQTIDPATIAEIWAGLEAEKYISPSTLAGADTPVALVEEDDGPVFIDLGAGRNFLLTLTTDQQIDSPLDQMPGRRGKIIVIQDDVGGHTLGWLEDWVPGGEADLGVRAGPGEITIFEYTVRSVGNVVLERMPESASLSDVLAGDSEDTFLSPYTSFESMADVTLTDGPTIIPNLNQGLNFSLTIEDDRHISNPTGQRRGKQGRFYIQQGTLGGNQVTWGTDFRFVGGVVPTIPSVPGVWTVVPYEVRYPGFIIAAAVDPYSGSGGSGVDPATEGEVKSASPVLRYVSPSTLAAIKSPVIPPDASTFTPDLHAGVNFNITLLRDMQILNMAHQRLGESGFFIFVQGGAGNYSVTWDSNYSFIGGVPTIPTGVGEIVVLQYVVQAFGIIRVINFQTSAAALPATVQEVWAGIVNNKYIPPSVALAANTFVTLTDVPTITLDLNTGINFKVTITDDRALANPTNQVAGKEGVLKIKQDSVGGRGFSWGNQYVFEGGEPSMPTDPDAHVTIPYHVESVGAVLVG